MIVYSINRYRDKSASGLLVFELWTCLYGFDITILNIGFGFRF